MFKKAWAIFYRAVVAVGILLLCFVFIVIWGFSTPNVSQSDGFVDRADIPREHLNREILPASAKEIRYASGSVGMGGRLLLLRFTAPVDELHDHAKKMFGGVDASKLVVEPDSESFFTERELSMVKEGHGIDASWMMPPEGAKGVLYTAPSETTSRTPRIFVDEKASVLYSMLTD